MTLALWLGGGILFVALVDGYFCYRRRRLYRQLDEEFPGWRNHR